VNVLSLFDGMSCGMLALDRLGIKVDKYYASEIDKYAMQVSAANYPEIIQVGDITKLDLSTLPKIDLVMGGSPCQGFSFAGKQLAFDDPRSALFFEFVKCVKELNPKYFLLENVKMKKEYLDIISEYMGVEPIFINSSLVSAQSRQRYYWTNILNVSVPEDRGLVLRDILEDGFDTERDKSHCLDANYYKGSSVENYLKKSRRQMVFKPQRVGTIKDGGQGNRIYSQDGKGISISAQSGGTAGNGNMLVETSNKLGQTGNTFDVRAMTEVRTPEANQIRYEHKRRTGKDWSPRHMRHLVERPDEKMNTLTSALTKQHILQITKDQESYWRKLTPIECERLQTVPDNYTNHVSNTQRYKMLGNGWTIEVIAHILKNMETEQ
jgi:DNA (cytosine-5)-methyltransferase 3A